MIVIAVTNAHKRHRVPRAPVLRAVRRVLRGEGVRDGAVSVIFIGTALCRSLNRRYLRHPWTTDVISFPLGEGGRLEGEVYVNLDRACAQAREERVTATEEILRLVIHGVLHLTGSTDGTRSERSRMHELENTYLRARRAPGGNA